MTSGNLSEEPIACGNEEALRRLSGIADGFLFHDREIESRCDDSVARVVAGGPVLLRRSRGWVPRSISVDVPFDEPVLAVGGDLKNTFCIGLGGPAYLGPHIGDLGEPGDAGGVRGGRRADGAFLGVSSEIIAHDLHPGLRLDPLRARIAIRRGRWPSSTTMPTSRAPWRSTASTGPVLGVAWDGTGYGTDGTAWGGEIFLARFAGFERLAHLPAVALAGGETAIREPWRMAFALLDDAYPEGAPLTGFRSSRAMPRAMLDLVRQMLDGGSTLLWRAGSAATSTPSAPSFLPGRSRATRARSRSLERRRRPGRRGGTYPFSIGQGSLPELDLRLTVRAAVATSSGAHTGRRSPRDSTRPWPARPRRWCPRAEKTRGLGDLPVVLTGGCFQNALLAERVLARALAPAPRLSAPAGASGRRRSRARPGDRRQRASRAEGRSLMCLGVPGRVVSVDGTVALVDFWGVRRRGLPGDRRRARGAGRLHPEPRRLRNSEHSRRGHRRDAGALRDLMREAPGGTSWPPTSAARSRHGRAGRAQ